MVFFSELMLQCLLGAGLNVKFSKFSTRDLRIGLVNLISSDVPYIISHGFAPQSSLNGL